MIKEVEHFFYMGGYGLYVWLAYGMAFLVLLLNVLMPIWKQQKIMKSITFDVHPRDTHHESQTPP